MFVYMYYCMIMPQIFMCISLIKLLTMYICLSPSCMIQTFQCRSLELSSKGNLEIPPPSSASGHARSPPPVPRKGPEQSPSVTDQAGLGSREKVCMMPYLTEVKFYSPQ